MAKPLVWIIDEEWADYDVETEILTARYPDVEIRRSTYDYAADLAAFGYAADFILAQIYAPLPAEVLRQLQHCKGIAVYGGGYDRVDIETAREMGIKVTNVQGYCAEDLADYVIAAIYNHNKDLTSYREDVTNGVWGAPAAKHNYHRVSASTLLIIGCGTIGRTLAGKAKALGMRVLGSDPHIPVELAEAAGIELVSLEDGLAQADYISCHVKLTEQTVGIIGEREFSLMKPNAYFINTARGKLLDEAALIKACESGQIAGACVDVIAEEPATGKEPILTCDKILVTPHISYISQESFRTLKERTVENAITMYEGGEPKDWVNRW